MRSFPARVAFRLPILSFLVASTILFLVAPPGVRGRPRPPDDRERIGRSEEEEKSYLDRLQEEDRRFFSDELLDIDPAIRDSALNTLTGVGFEEYLEQSRRRHPAIEYDLEAADDLMTYNRVEGPVIGLKSVLSHRRGASVEIQGAYATASEKLRHLEVLRYPITRGRRAWSVGVGYGDRVLPYGSNRPAGNTLRALFGSADEQDYLRSQAGWGIVTLRLEGILSLRAGYRGARETSIGVHTDFGLLGDHRLLARNAPVNEGYDRNVFVEGLWGSLTAGRQELAGRFQVSGGALGGDFTYTRTDLRASVRRYLLGNHELTADLALSRAGGVPPLQRLADVGGLSTVRGFDRRTRTGEASLSARLELLLPYNLPGMTGLSALRDLRLQLVPWVDAGRVWSGSSHAWLGACGFGIQRYLGPFGSGSFLRLDLAFPTGPDRNEDSRLYLHFWRGIF
jgi:hypothetical protein